jgi:hypothetical protein
LIHRYLRAATVQEPDNNLFTEMCWQRRNAKVNSLSFISKAASAILRPPAISDIHSRDDFHSRD